jgi:DNA modification methylase
MSDVIAPLEWYTEKRKVKDLIPYEYNPRTLSDEKKEKLKKSLEKFNLAEIPAINTDNKILAGHQRILILMEVGRGEEEIDVRIPNRPLTAQEFKEYNITSNVPVGDWNVEFLETYFADIDLGGLGLNVEELKLPDLVPENLKKEEEQDFDPTPAKEIITQEGDLYELSSIEKDITHRVFCADSTLNENYEKLLLDHLFNLIITDPPYNVNYEGGTKEKLKIQNDKMGDDQFFTFLYLFYQEAFLKSKKGSSIYIFHAQNESVNFQHAFKESGWKLSQCLIWNKSSLAMGRQDYQWKHEPILYGWKEGASHRWFNDRKQTTVLEFNRPFRNSDHPTMKPIEILIYLIKNSSKQKEIVGDMFLGSGSTLIACEQVWRNCFGMELDPKYVDVIIRRWISYMKDNGLSFEIKRNGEVLNPEQIEQYESNG